MPNSRTAVPMISVIRFAAVFRMAGPVQNTASFRPVSSVSDQCDEVREPHERGSEECPDELARDERRNVAPRESELLGTDRREAEGHGRVEVREASSDRQAPEHADEHSHRPAPR